MSRSYRHTPIHGIAGDSDKKDKVLSHRAYRKNLKTRINTCADYDNLVLRPHDRHGNPWSWKSDGKSGYWSLRNAEEADADHPGNNHHLYKRFDICYVNIWRKMMRK